MATQQTIISVVLGVTVSAAIVMAMIPGQAKQAAPASLTQNVKMVGTRPGDIGKTEDYLAAARKRGNDLAMVAAGCFWCIEDAYRRVPGVVATAVGFSGGTTVNPTYHDVCADTTGHAECTLIEFNPKKITYQKILDLFWFWHDPTELNRQGPDTGTQYRSAIFTFDAEQEKLARASMEAESKKDKYSKPIVTEIKPAGPFYMAEDYHQQYYTKNGIKNHKVPE